MTNATGRPNGRMLTAWGWIALVFGVLATIVGFMLPVFTDPGSGGVPPYVPPTMPVVNAWKWPVTWCGIGATNIGVLLVLTGYIVHAISLVPAGLPKDNAEGAFDAEPTAAQAQDADIPWGRAAAIVGVMVAVLGGVTLVILLASSEVPPTTGANHSAVEALEASADNLQAEAAAAVEEAKSGAMRDAAEAERFAPAARQDKCYEGYCPCDPPQGGPDSLICDRLTAGIEVPTALLIAGKDAREDRKQLAEGHP